MTERPNSAPLHRSQQSPCMAKLECQLPVLLQRLKRRIGEGHTHDERMHGIDTVDSPFRVELASSANFGFDIVITTFAPRWSSKAHHDCSLGSAWIGVRELPRRYHLHTRYVL